MTVLTLLQNVYLAFPKPENQIISIIEIRKKNQRAPTESVRYVFQTLKLELTTVQLQDASLKKGEINIYY